MHGIFCLRFQIILRVFMSSPLFGGCGGLPGFPRRKGTSFRLGDGSETVQYVRRVTEKMLLAGGKSSGSIWRGLLTFQGLWIGRPFVHQPAKDRCGTHRDHGKRKYNNQREPISQVKYQWNGCVRGISKASMSGLLWLLSRQTALAPSISALFIIPLVGENKAPGSEFPGALFFISRSDHSM